MHREYLAADQVMATRSLEEARDAVTRVYLPHELVGESEAMDMRLNAVSDQVLTLGYLTYQAETELRMPATEQWYHVNLQMTGETWCSRRDGATEHTPAGARGLVLNPEQATTVRWSADAEQLILKVSRSALESHLADLLGRPVTDVVDFDFGLDLTTAAGRSLVRSVEFLALELERPDGVRDLPLARRQLESYVLTALLHAGRHQYSDALLGREDVARLGRLGPVVRHIEEHADADLTPESLARVACVSVRTLHAAFAEQLGETPMAYVRRVRLGKVRADLLRADPLRTRVTDIAMRWGFFHPSRFSQQYRDQFGELPSVTLQR
ncbi:AraC family transcriptional regulator [Nocardioides sp. TRM66260-LWL]|uniref:AraC family transcriptional regulator n=1 Tax=Nocardioides sp. TRM66260-LWL TaxID=2874478 RepID=UPI001CC4056A|nr:AraC family transcriptional regulator [Nocardioides sp. TRM66260-LWL]MBZ5735606.1 AraC family transcriptional regulator [Nocardioides sp. TRM66260-LWL]